MFDEIYVKALKKAIKEQTGRDVPISFNSDGTIEVYSSNESQFILKEEDGLYNVYWKERGKLTLWHTCGRHGNPKLDFALWVKANFGGEREKSPEELSRENSIRRKAAEAYEKTKNCAQAVFSAFAPEYGLSEELARKLASGFSGGMRNAETCGAVTGGVMVINLAKGDGSETPDNSRCYIDAARFTWDFRATNGSLVCRELLKTDIFEGNNMQTAAKQGLFNELCPKYVDEAVKILLKLGY